MGYSDPGCFGSELVETPNIDHLAENGLRFTNFYNTGRCWPTRTSLLSGYYAHQVLSDPIDGVDYQSGSFRPATETWLPQLLKNHGYRCYHSGKWHIFRRVPEFCEMTHDQVGFDRSYRIEDGRHLRPKLLREDGDTLPLPGPGSRYEASTAIVDHAIKYLREHKQEHGEEPFFEYIAFIAPHFPLQALQEDIDSYRGKFMMGWDEVRIRRTENREMMGFEVNRLHPPEPDRFAPWNLSPEDLVTQIDPAETGRAVPWASLTPDQQDFQAEKMAIHAAMVTRMDHEIGRFVEVLGELDYLQSTIIFFCSDNGASTEMMNRADRHTIGSVPGSADSYLCLGPGWSTAANTPFRLHKTWVHEGGIATPMVVHWPEKIRDANSFRDMPSHIIDIAPTLLELAGGNADELDSRFEAPGISLVPFFDRNVIRERHPLFFHHEKKNALRSGRWKIVTIDQGEPWELYDLSADRGETNDLAGKNPGILGEMVALWESLRTEIIEQIRDTTVVHSP